MCEYCEGRKLLTHVDNENELGSYCGVVAGTHKKLSMGIFGRHIYVNGRVRHMNAEDCYYTAALDDDDNLGFSSGMHEEVQIKYCPMCGRRLEGQAVAWADAKDAEAEISNLEGLLMDMDPTVELCEVSDGIPALYVTIFTSNDEYKRVKKREAKLREHLHESYKMGPMMQRYPEIDLFTSQLEEFPAEEFMEAGAVFNKAWNKRMRITSAGLRAVIQGNGRTRAVYQGEGVVVTEELIAGYEAFIQGIHDRIAGLKVKAEAFKALAAETVDNEEMMDRGRVADLISGFFTTHQWNAYYEQDYCMGSLGPEPGLNIERLRTDVEAYIDRARATNH